MDKIGICGAGLIGASWAIGFANAGFKCFVYDANQNSFAKFSKTSNKLIQDLRIINPDTVSYTHLTLPTKLSV